MKKKNEFYGVWCPSITPMTSAGKIDLNGLRQHISRLTEASIDVVLLMGSIGEFASFTLDERLMLIREVRGVCAECDVVICCLGLDAGLEGEEGDQGNQPDSLPYPTENPWG